MNVRELRRKYLAFFESKGHARASASPLIPYDVVGNLDETLMFNGSGMNQFKPYFRGLAQPPTKRLITAQKCLRTGDIEEVGDNSHLTLFEMLGNFSFGDYFKKDAIDYSWEFLTSTEWLGLDPTRLAFTVFLDDQEAYGYWADHLSGAGIDPGTRIFLLGEETNYWPAGAFSKGPPGPCGPNSEMFYWVKGTPPEGAYGTQDFLRDDEAGNWLEIWNDVFITYDWQGAPRDPSRPDKGYEKTGMPYLPFKSIDTGMGLERAATVIGGFGSVYDTDAFQPIFRLLEGLTKESDTPLSYGSSPETTRAMRIIADHLRAATFCISDGILPANNGRGYVLRRLIRRAVLKGARTLGFTSLFLFELVPAVSDNMGDDYPELREKQAIIVETLRNEEALFRRTLKQGNELLTEWLGVLTGGVLSGEQAFMLYDTYGFPLEVTQEICAEANVEVDSEGYETAMKEAQERSRGANVIEGPYTASTANEIAAGRPPTEFIGYDATTAEAKVVAYQETGGKATLVLDRTPFYAESGGQVGDTGTISANGRSVRVLDTKKSNGVFIHTVEPYDQLEALPVINAFVDEERRLAIRRHHTATHLMQAALRSVLGAHVTQAGSLVNEDQLRFDFTHGKAMTSDEIRAVEDLVNQKVLEALPVLTYEDLPIDQARAMGAMALFGEKYGDFVRVVQVGAMPPQEPSFSRELCGGIHVANTGQIGLFKVTSEASAASGVRRITAVAGVKSIELVNDLQDSLERAATALKTTSKDLVSAIHKLQEALKEEKRKRERTSNQTNSTAQVETIGVFEFVVENLIDEAPDDVKAYADRLAEVSTKRVVIVTNIAGDKITFACKVGSEALKAGAKAGQIVKVMAQVTGGGGGGRDEFATAGGRDITKIEEALSAARDALKGVSQL